MRLRTSDSGKISGWQPLVHRLIRAFLMIVAVLCRMSAPHVLSCVGSKVHHSFLRLFRVCGPAPDFGGAGSCSQRSSDQAVVRGWLRTNH